MTQQVNYRHHAVLCRNHKAGLTDTQKHGTYYKTDSYLPGDRFHWWAQCYLDRGP